MFDLKISEDHKPIVKMKKEKFEDILEELELKFGGSKNSNSK